MTKSRRKAMKRYGWPMLRGDEVWDSNTARGQCARLISVCCAAEGNRTSCLLRSPP